jgi:hypothetical protein
VNKKQVLSDLLIKETEINKAITDQAGLYGYYSMIAHNAHVEYKNAKLNVDIMASEISNEMRIDAITKGEKKPSEEFIKNELPRNPKMKEAYLILIEKETEYELCRNVLEALKHKKDMIYQTAMNVREEMKSDICIKSAANYPNQERLVSQIREKNSIDNA